MKQEMPPADLDSRPKPIVAIPWRWSWWLLYVAPAIPMALAAILLMADPDKVRQGQPPGTVALTPWIGALWPLAVMLLVVVPMAIWLNRAPEFAVFQSGIKVNVKRVPPGRSVWDPWAYGFYSWDEVSDCRWSPYQPGVLSVHLASAEQEAAGLPGTVSRSLMRVPPMIYLSRARAPSRRGRGGDPGIRQVGRRNPTELTAVASLRRSGRTTAPQCSGKHRPSWHNLGIDGHLIEGSVRDRRAEGLLSLRNAVRPVAITPRRTRHGHKERIMTSSHWFILSLFSLFVTASIVWEVLARRKAGPIHFRLPLASMAKPPRRTRTGCMILFVLGMFLVITAAFLSGNPRDLVVPIFFLWVLVTNLQTVHPRRHTIRWLVLASGLLGLVLAAILLASGLGVFQASLFRTQWFTLIFSALLLAVGGVTIWQGLSGTLVRERGLEIMGATHPWSLIVIKDWQECDGGFALRLTLVSPRLFGMPYGRDVEMIIPIPAAERPALEAFLAGRAATAGADEPMKANATHAPQLLHADLKGRNDPTEEDRCR